MIWKVVQKVKEMWDMNRKIYNIQNCREKEREKKKVVKLHKKTRKLKKVMRIL